MSLRHFTSALIGFVLASTASASNSGVTYQGRILKPDGTALTGVTTQFKLQIRTPDAQNCLMYEEAQTQDLSKANGAFSLTINDGSGARTDSTGLTLDKIFANRGTLTFDSTTCSTGAGSWAPNASDGRNLVVLFKDETMSAWEPIPAQKINYIPFAFEAKQVQGFTTDSLLKVVDGSGNPQTGISPLSNAQYAALLALANGSSTAYTAAGTLGGSALPTMTSGQVLGWNGTAWTSTSPVPAAGSITSTQLASGAVTTSNIAGNVSINTTGTLGSAITTTRDFKIYAASPGTGFLEMKAPAIPDGTSYTLTWPLNVGTAGQVLTSDGTGVLSWAAAGTSSQWTTHAANISYDGGGKVGIGTTAPSAPLTVIGAVDATSYQLYDTNFLSGDVSYGTVAVGIGALSNQFGWEDVAIGRYALSSELSSGFFNTAVGGHASQKATGFMNTSVGYQAAANGTYQEKNTFLGANAGTGNAAGYSSNGLVVVGATAGATLQSGSNYNTFVGAGSGANVTTGAANTFVGGYPYPYTGTNVTTGSGNIGLGYAISMPNAASDNQMNIGNLIFGSGMTGSLGAPTGKVGIGTTSPTALLNLKAGTATASTAPLKFTTGTVLTTPEDGAMEYASSNLYYTIGSTRYVIPMNTAAGNYSNVSTIGNSSGSITMTPMSGNSVIVNATTVSTSPTTGALIVNGGAGISGALNTSGNIMSGGSITATTNGVIPQLYGSTAASGNIKIDGTSNATVGNVLLATAGGYVGIGTTAPARALDVVGQIGATSGISGTTFNSVATGPTAVLLSTYASADATDEKYWDWYRDATTLNLRALNDAYSASNTAISIKRVTNTISNVTFPNGNVGIGTTSPTTLFQVMNTNSAAPTIVASRAVNGYQATTGYYPAGSVSASNPNWATGLLPASADYSIQTYDGSLAVPRMIVQANTGNVGIGTTAPTSLLHVSGIKPTFMAEDTGGGTGGGGTLAVRQSTGVVTSGNERLGAINFNGSSNGGVLQVGSAIESYAANGWGSAGYVDSYMKFNIGKGGTLSEVMRLANTGNVGIGTTAPGTSLDVKGGIRAGAATVVTATCNSTNEGIQRYNYSTHFMEYCNGSNWIQLVAQAAGATIPVSAMGPPVGANIYTFTGATANYTPTFGSVANTYDGTWITSGTNGASNAACVQMSPNTSNAIVYDLGSVKTIGTVYVSAEGPPYNYMIPGLAFSTDGVTYASSVTVNYLPNNQSIQYTSATLGTAVTARYIRLTNAGSTDNAASTFCDLAVGP